MQARRFLFVMFEGGGNVPPQLALARRLVARGHAVEVLGDPALAGAARAAGCTHAAFRQAPHHDFRRQAATRLDERFYVGPLGRYALDVIQHAARVAPDAIVVDHVLSGAIAGAEASGRPFAVAVHSIWRARGFERGLGALRALRAALGLAPVARGVDQLRGASRVLVLSARAFDPDPVGLPANARYVGPQLDDPAWAGPPPAGLPAAPFALAALGSNPQGQRRPIARLIVALAAERVPIVVTTACQAARGALPRRAGLVVLESAPHGALMPAASLVVCHGGHGTLIKALAAGRPALCLVGRGEQRDMGARLVASGAGLTLTRGATIAALRAAVRRLLDEPGFAAAAGAMQRAIAAELAEDVAVAELEALAGIGR